MSEASVVAGSAPKAKKSVALSGVPAGNTALCTVGRTVPVIVPACVRRSIALPSGSVSSIT